MRRKAVLWMILTPLVFCMAGCTGAVQDVKEVSKEEIPDTEAMAFVRDMKAGWSLGNTLDAYNGAGVSADDLSTETCWGNPNTTQEMIDAVQEAGFNTLRIPVTWHGHVVTDEDGSVSISSVWLDRVQEVVDYAYGNGMYVIINIHHDTDTEYGYYPDSAHYEKSEKFIRGIWTDLAERFKDYDSHLIFESMNEPRLVGTGYEWNFRESAAECQDSIDCINRLNQVFVDTVRDSGGGNADRYLMVPGYSASLAGVMTDLFILPDDSAKDRLIISAHAYTPYNFALQPQEESGATDRFSVQDVSSTKEIDSTMQQLFKKFVSQGIPVVIGEYGARNKNDNLEDRVQYYTYYVTAARQKGITCCVWDNGAFGGNGEQFGLLRRRQKKMEYPDIINAIMEHA